jgi:hypothetical protein
MNKIAKHLVVCLLAVSLLLAPLAGSALAYRDRVDEKVSAEKMTADLLIVRPIGLISMLAGSMLFVVSLPFSWTEKNDSQEDYANSLSENLDKFLAEPSRYTFQRRLGRF